jgi:hypothetical protein
MDPKVQLAKVVREPKDHRLTGKQANKARAKLEVWALQTLHNPVELLICGNFVLGSFVESIHLPDFQYASCIIIHHPSTIKGSGNATGSKLL